MSYLPTHIVSFTPHLFNNHLTTYIHHEYLCILLSKKKRENPMYSMQINRRNDIRSFDDHFRILTLGS